eukprot:gene14878-biopygen10057
MRAAAHSPRLGRRGGERTCRSQRSSFGHLGQFGEAGLRCRTAEHRRQVKTKTAEDSVFSCALRSAAFCVQEPAFCVQMPSPWAQRSIRSNGPSRRRCSPGHCVPSLPSGVSASGNFRLKSVALTHLIFPRFEPSSSSRMRRLFPKAAGGWAAPRCAGGAARVQLRSAFRNLRSAFRNPRSAFRSCVLRSAAFCVQLRSEACVRLRSRSAAFCVRLRSANIGAIVRHDESSVCHRAP